MKNLRTVKKGEMHPLNYASRLIKEASDLMFSIALNDELSVDSRLRECERLIAELKNVIKIIKEA